MVYDLYMKENNEATWLKQKAATKLKKHSIRSITQDNENKAMRTCTAVSIETKLWIKNSLSSPIHHPFIHSSILIPESYVTDGTGLKHTHTTFPFS